MSATRHLWRPREGTDRDGARCARCGLLRRTETVERGRITANAARVSWRAEPVYSWRGERWSLERPVCPGEVTAARRTYAPEGNPP